MKNTAGHYEITICFESPDLENAEFVYSLLTHMCCGFEDAGLVQVALATIHPTFEGDEIREESY